MVRSHERRSEVRPPAQALRVEWDSTDLLAGVRAEMAAVRERLLELAGTSAPTLRATDPMPPQRLKQLKGRITVVSGWGERALSSS